MRVKTPLVVACLLFLMSAGAFSTLTNFKYTGIAFDGSGNILAGTTVDVQIDLIDGGTLYFSEKHTAVQTDQFGAYTVEVGTGNLLSGSLGSVTVTKTLKIKSTVTSGGSSGVWVVSSLIKPNSAITTLNTSENQFWQLNGNSGTTSGTDFLGVTDNKEFELKVSNVAGTYYNKLILGTNNDIFREGSGASVPGNPRNICAVDLQSYRTAASQVVSGIYSTISGGSSNTVTSSNSTISGGFNNSISRNRSTIGGGANNLSSGGGALITGGYNANAEKQGQFAYASGSFTNPGDAQTTVFVVRNETTIDTTVQLLSGASRQLTIPPNTTWLYRVLLTARNTNGLANSASWEITGLIDRSSFSTPTVSTITNTPAWPAPTVTRSGNNMAINVTGVAATTIRWVARVEIVEVNL